MAGEAELDDIDTFLQKEAAATDSRESNSSRLKSSRSSRLPPKLHLQQLEAAIEPLEDSFEHVEYPPKPTSLKYYYEKSGDNAGRPNSSGKSCGTAGLGARGPPLGLNRKAFEAMKDSDGRIINEHALRQAVFKGGIEENIRKEVWQFLFGLYPFTSSLRERAAIRDEARLKFAALKHRWKTKIMNQTSPDAGCVDYLTEEECRSSNVTQPIPCGATSSLDCATSHAAHTDSRTTNKETHTADTSSNKPQYDPLINADIRLRSDNVGSALNVTTAASQHGTSSCSQKDKLSGCSEGESSQKIGESSHREDKMVASCQQQMTFLELQAQVYAGRKEIIKGDLITYIRIIDKDVPRTDRDQDYFKESTPLSLRTLRDILITFAAYHPDVSYAQGMNDIAARFLRVMITATDSTRDKNSDNTSDKNSDSDIASEDDVSAAYWCFTNFIERIRHEFTEEGMAAKLVLLQKLLEHMDPDLYRYLHYCQVGDLMFCHRWLLLSFKREFDYVPGVKMFEILCSHYLEVNSVAAANELVLETRRLFERDGGKCRGSAAEWSMDDEFTFDLFVCVAILIEHRRHIFTDCDDPASIFQCINSVTKSLDVDTVISKAEALFHTYCHKAVLDCFEIVDTPTPPLSLPPAAAAALSLHPANT